jgi:hypothetical protein
LFVVVVVVGVGGGGGGGGRADRAPEGLGSVWSGVV